MTVEEFLLSSNKWSITELMVDFAKYHVALALEAASKNAEAYNIDEAGQEIYTDAKVKKESILTSYPLENIK